MPEIQIEPEISRNNGGSEKFRSIFPSYDFVASTGFHRGPTRKGRGYKLIIFSFAAAAIDVLLGLAFFCFALLFSSLLIKTNLLVKNISTYNEFALFVIFFVGLVCMLQRSFLGFTVGDWACGIRLGEVKEQFKNTYVLQVVYRFLVIFLSGIIVLPICSLILGFDLAGKISGLYLVSKE